MSRECRKPSQTDSCPLCLFRGKAYLHKELPFPHPKYHVRPSTGNIYETTSPIPEEYDPVTGYIDSVLSIMGTSEVYEIGERLKIEEGEESLKYGGKGSTEWWNSETRQNLWMGRVEYPESSERTSIEREARRAREETQKGQQQEVDVQRNEGRKEKC